MTKIKPRSDVFEAGSPSRRHHMLFKHCSGQFGNRRSVPDDSPSLPLTPSAAPRFNNISRHFPPLQWLPPYLAFVPLNVDSLTWSLVLANRTMSEQSKRVPNRDGTERAGLFSSCSALPSASTAGDNLTKKKNNKRRRRRRNKAWRHSKNWLDVLQHPQLWL